jgi:hypothetical protein
MYIVPEQESAIYRRLEARVWIQNTEPRFCNQQNTENKRLESTEYWNKSLLCKILEQESGIYRVPKQESAIYRILKQESDLQNTATGVWSLQNMGSWLELVYEEEQYTVHNTVQNTRFCERRNSVA